MSDISLSPLFLAATIAALTLLAVAATALRDALRSRSLYDRILPARLRDVLGIKAVPPWLALSLFILWAALFLTLLLNLLFVTANLFAAYNTIEIARPETGLLLRWTLLTITALTASLGAVVAFPFTVLRTRANQRQTETAEQGLITDRINKAVEGLGAEKTAKRLVRIKDAEGNRTTVTKEETEPNIEVRIGAIYSLERIAKDSERDHLQIMEILCAYIRQNAPASDAQPCPVTDWPDYPTEPTKDAVKGWPDTYDSNKTKLFQWCEDLRTNHKPRPDIQTALSVLGRRPRVDTIEARPYRGTDRYRLDLCNTNLQAADLAHFDLRHALFENAMMQGADLSWAEMHGANLRSAEMQGAHLIMAEMQGAVLVEAKMQGANLALAKMRGANLELAKMQGANLELAKMQGANLALAKMRGANLELAKMQGANLELAKMQGANLALAKMQGANLGSAEMQGANLGSAEVQGAVLTKAEMRSTNWTGLHIDSATAQFVDLRGATNLTQSHLSSLVGNAATLLPEGTDLYIPDRWATPPPNWDVLVATHTRIGKTRKDLERRYLCPPGTRPQKTGTPHPLDAPPPWGDGDPEEWARVQETRGEIDD